VKGQNIHIGDLPRVLLGGGTFSTLRWESPKAGLSLIPDTDPEFRAEQAGSKDCVACSRFGHVGPESSTAHTTCPQCHSERWQKAIV
jgi:hypothetical protein